MIWLETVNGKPQPFDAKPEKRGIMRKAMYDGGSPRVAIVDTYMPHHATCQAVEMFRGNRTGTNG